MTGNADATTRFSSRVENYTRYRPGYPEELVPAIFARAGLSRGSVVADVGCGTGLSAVPFLEAGAEVVGVEPNGGMRGAADKLLEPFAGFRSIDGTAEATTLPDGSVDLVVCAQAFHWFDRERAHEEFMRIARGERWCAVVFNIRSLDATPFLRLYEAMLLECGTDYASVRHENVTDEVLARFFRNGYDTLSFPNSQTFDFDGLRGRLLSSSYVPAEGDAGYDRMISHLRSLFDGHQEEGKVRFEYETRLYLGRL